MFYCKLENQFIRCHDIKINGSDNSYLVVTPDSGDVGFSSRTLQRLLELGFQNTGGHFLQPFELDLKQAKTLIQSIGTDLKTDPKTHAVVEEESAYESQVYNLYPKSIVIDNDGESLEIPVHEFSDHIELVFDLKDVKSQQFLDALKNLDAMLANNSVALYEVKVPLNDLLERINFSSPKVNYTLVEDMEHEIMLDSATVLFESVDNPNTSTQGYVYILPKDSQNFSIATKKYIMDKLDVGNSLKPVFDVADGKNGYKLYVGDKYKLNRNNLTGEEKASIIQAQLHELTGAAPLCLFTRTPTQEALTPDQIKAGAKPVTGDSFIIGGDDRLNDIVHFFSNSPLRTDQKQIGNISCGRLRGVDFEAVYSELSPLLKPGVNLAKQPGLASTVNYKYQDTLERVWEDKLLKECPTIGEAASIICGEKSNFFSSALVDAFNDALKPYGSPNLSSEDFMSVTSGLKVKSSALKNSGCYVSISDQQGKGPLVKISAQNGSSDQIISIGGIIAKEYSAYSKEKLRLYSQGQPVELADVMSDVERNALKEKAAKENQALFEKGRQDAKKRLDDHVVAFNYKDTDLTDSWEFERKNVTPTPGEFIRLGKTDSGGQSLDALIIELSNAPKIDVEPLSYQEVITAKKGQKASKDFGFDMALSENTIGETGRTGVHAVKPIEPDKGFVIGEGVMDTYFNLEIFQELKETTNFIAALNAKKLDEVFRIAYDKTGGKKPIALVSDNDMYKVEVGNVGLQATLNGLIKMAAQGKDLSLVSLHSPMIGDINDNVEKTGAYTDPTDITPVHSPAIQKIKIERLITSLVERNVFDIEKIPKISIYKNQVPESVELGYAIDERDEDEEQLTVDELMEEFANALHTSDKFMISERSSGLITKELLKLHMAPDLLEKKDFESLVIKAAEYAATPLKLKDKLVDGNGQPIVGSHPVLQAHSFHLDPAYIADDDNKIWMHYGDNASTVAKVDSVELEIDPTFELKPGALVPVTLPNQEIQTGFIIQVEGDGHIGLTSGDTFKTRLLDNEKNPIQSGSDVANNIGLTGNNVIIDSDMRVLNEDGSQLNAYGQPAFCRVNQRANSVLANGKAQSSRPLLSGTGGGLFLKVADTLEANNIANKWFDNMVKASKTYYLQTGKTEQEALSSTIELMEKVRDSYMARTNIKHNSRYLDSYEYLKEMDEGFKVLENTHFIRNLDDPTLFSRVVGSSFEGQFYQGDKEFAHKQSDMDATRVSIKALIDYHSTVYFESNYPADTAVKIESNALYGEKDSYLLTYVNADGRSSSEPIEILGKDLVDPEFINTLRSPPKLLAISNSFTLDQIQASDVLFNENHIAALQQYDPKKGLRSIAEKLFRQQRSDSPISRTKTFNEIRQLETANKANEDWLLAEQTVESLEKIVSDRNILGRLRGTHYSHRFVELNPDVQAKNLKVPALTIVTNFQPYRGGKERNKDVFIRRMKEFDAEIAEIEKNAPSVTSAKIKIDYINEQKKDLIKYMQLNQDSPVLNHTSGLERNNQSFAFVPKRLDFYRRIHQLDGSERFEPSASLLFKRIYNESQDYARILGHKHLRDTGFGTDKPEDKAKYKEAMKEFSKRHEPFSVDTLLKVNLLPSEQDQLEDYGLRGRETNKVGGKNSVNIANAPEEQEQYQRMCGHEVLSGSKIQGYRNKNHVTNFHKINEFIYRIKGGVPSDYRALQKDIVELVNLEGIFDPDEEVSLELYQKNSWRTGTDLDNPRSIFGVAVPEIYTETVNKMLSARGDLSIDEFNWIDKPADYPCPFVTSSDLGRSEMDDRKELVNNLMNIPRYVEQSDGSIKLLDNNPQSHDISMEIENSAIADLEKSLEDEPNQDPSKIINKKR